MQRRQFLKTTGLAASLAITGSAFAETKSVVPAKAAKKRPPNIILILADDLGYGDLSCYGSKVIKTPRLDQMAKDGVRMTRFYAVASICTPSRAGLLTGSYPQRCGLYMGISPNRAEHRHLGLHPEETTIAESLKAAGYATLCVGKWHLGSDDVFHPMNHGFDEYFGMPCNFHHSPVLMRGRKVVAKKADLSKLTANYTKAAVEFITRKKDVPFFIYLPHTFPHLPLVASAKFKGKSKAGVYGDVIEEIDWSCGTILDTLKTLGLDENTIVIFTSDNGPTPKAAKAYQSAGKFKGSKYTSFEGGHREPCIIRWPGEIPAGQTCAELASTMDFLPTLLARAGAKLPANEIDGKDIFPLIDGTPRAKSPHEVLYYYNCDNLQAVLWQQWKLHLPRTIEACPFWQKNKGWTELKTPKLFNLATDAGETKDVAAENPAVVKAMLALAETGREKFGDYGKRGSAQRKTGDSRILTPGAQPKQTPPAHKPKPKRKRKK